MWKNICRFLPRSDRFGGERYSDRYPVNGDGKEREYDRDGHSSSDRYGGGGGTHTRLPR